tara:strand:- start:11 stop:304 length:294 start_codon:yes stop_codon:yes gene_type:complete
VTGTSLHFHTDAAKDIIAINAAFGNQGVSAFVGLANADNAKGAKYITLECIEVSASSAKKSLVSVEAGDGKTIFKNTRDEVVLIDAVIKTVNNLTNV